MTEVPVSWLSYCGDNPARGRWDQAFLDRLLAGEEWRVPGGFRFKSVPWNPADGQGRVIVFPCGHYIEHGERHTAAWKLARDLAKLPWAVVIATSDESDSFEWNKFDLPDHAKLWVQTPRPESTYPDGTFFHPLGSPTSARVWGGPHDKTIDVFFAGQVNHTRREDCVTELMKLAMERPDLNVEVLPTEGFTLGLSPEEYQDKMRAARVVPCPAGICSQESFRSYEALEAGAMPIVDQYRPGGFEGDGFWTMVAAPAATEVESWWEFPGLMSRVIEDPYWAPAISAEWQQYKRKIAYRLNDDLWDVMQTRPVQEFGPADEITVCIVTSPAPSHPSTTMIEETIASVQERLPGAEIHLLIDGVREEQSDRADDYWEYARRLCGLVNADPTIVPYVAPEHQHQSGMFRLAVNRIKTPYVMFVEHDTPLVGDIDFDRVLAAMSAHEIASMRFLHEVSVPPGSEGLFLDSVAGREDRPFLRTVQWSQRPHVARTDWYRDIMATYFGWGSRTMIEDVMHGVVQHMHTGDRTAVRKGFQKWRMAVWAPEENFKHSGHLDGREGDPKYGMTVRYDADRPDGAPPEGVIS